MGEIVDKAFEQLKKDNKNVNASILRVYIDALSVYLEASKNIRMHGAIVSHPKTGSPIENPYLKVQAACGKTVAYYAKIDAVKATKLIEDSLLEAV